MSKPILRDDVARCLGRRDWTPETGTCPQRGGCLRYLAAADGQFGQYGRSPWHMWMCETGTYEQRRPEPHKQADTL